MPDDLKRAIVEAIAGSSDENYKRLLLLLMRVEEVFLDRITDLTDQMTVPAQQHSDDHNWIADRRDSDNTVKSDAHKIAVSLLDKGLFALAGAMAMKYFGV